jgi:hypothetical protein
MRVAWNTFDWSEPIRQIAGSTAGRFRDRFCSITPPLASSNPLGAEPAFPENVMQRLPVACLFRVQLYCSYLSIFPSKSDSSA